MSAPVDECGERAFIAVEELLAWLHPNENMAEKMASLRWHFVSAEAMFRADAAMLEQLGLCSADALLLSLLPELSRCIQRQRLEEHPVLANLSQAANYIITLYHGLQVERFYLLCLDARGRLRERIMMQQGTADGALFSQRQMLSEAIRTNASAVIISHNHPGMTLRPSEEDLRCTRDALRALGVVGIPLLDHIIIAGRKAVSLRQNGFISADLWLRQDPQSRLLRAWLEI